MKRYAQFMLAPLVLAACTSDPGGTNTDFGMTSNTAPTEIASSLSAIDYDPDSQELVLSMNTVHGGESNVTYVRTAALDTGGYEGYMLQRSPADRHYTALFGESNDGQLIAGAVGDGGNNNYSFGGAFYGQQGLRTYSPYQHAPTEGAVHYYGEYAGITNLSSDGDQLLDASGIPANITPPAQSDRVVGIIQLDADFATGKVEGEISNRVLIDDRLGLNDDPGTVEYDGLPDIILVKTDITADGTFEGTTEFEGKPSSPMGNFAGIFGGAGATSVAGAVYLEDFADNELPNTTETEYGVFILTRCGAPGAHAVCSSL